MCEHEKKSCPRCQREFECKAGSILLCQCVTVDLSPEQRHYIAMQYADCLCAGCLQDMKTVFHRHQFRDRLYRISALLFKKPETDEQPTGRKNKSC